MDVDLILKQLGVDLVGDADDLDQIDEGTEKFKLYARDHVQLSDGTWVGAKLAAVIEKADTAEEEWLLNGIASSTIKDRHGDVMLPSALIDMERAANDALTMFLNHKYEVPEDVAGTVKSAKIVSFGVEKETGAPIYDLDYQFRLNRRNERAKDSFLSIKDGTKLGLSIGARIPEGGAIRNKKTGKLLIAHVDLLETSIVGVPANPRSWVEQATKSINEAIEKRKVFALGELKVAQVDNAKTVIDAAVEAAREDISKVGVTEGDVAAFAEISDTLTASTAPSQDAPESTPGDDGQTASTDVSAAATSPEVPADIAKASSPELVALLLQSQESISELAKRVTDLSENLRKAEQRAADAERERDTVVKVAKDLAADTAQIIHRLGSLPVGQRASFKRIQQDFNDGLDSATDIYGPEIVAMLRSKT